MECERWSVGRKLPFGGYYRNRTETSDDLVRIACDILNLVVGTQKGDSLCGRVAYQKTVLRYVML
jgi:hypothetical protein